MSSITQKVAELLSISVNLNIIMQAALNRIIVCEYQDVMKCREPKWLQISLFSGKHFHLPFVLMSMPPIVWSLLSRRFVARPGSHT